MPEDDKLLDALGDFAKFVDTMTGMRQQLVDQGWSQDHAEELVVAAMRGGQGR